MTRRALPLLIALGVSAAAAQSGGWGPASGPTGVRLQSIAVRGGEIFAGGEERFVYRSRDEGLSWKPIELDAGAETFALCGDVLLAGTRAGVRRLAPGDSAFKRSSGGITESFRVVVAAQGRFAFAGGDWGIRRSEDQGLAWSLPAPDLRDSIYFLAADSAGIVAAALNGRVYSSRDSGATWGRLADLRPYPSGLFRCRGRAFATQGFSALRLAEDGSKWDTVFAFAPGLYAARMFGSGPDLFAHSGDGLYRSGDLGGTWTRVSRVFGERNGLAGLAEKGGYLFAASAAGVFRSSDSGAGWIGLDNGLAVGPPRHGVAFLGDTVLAVGAGLLRRTTDLGAGWITLDSASGRVQPEALAAVPGHLFAGTARHGVLHSRDGGRTWDPSGTGLPADKWIDRLFLGAGALFAFVEGRTLYRSLDQGATWEAAQKGLPSVPFPVEPRTILAMGDTLFLGTVAGLYRSTDRGAAWAKAGSFGKHEGEVAELAALGGDFYAVVRDAPGDSVQGGLYVSRNRGGGWSRIPSQGIRDAAIGALAAYGSTLFAAADSGLYRSADSGLTWAPMNEGLPGGSTLGAAFWIHGASLYTSVGGLRMRPLSDFGPVGLARGGAAGKGARAGARPRLMRQGGSITVSVPDAAGEGRRGFDLRGQAKDAE